MNQQLNNMIICTSLIFRTYGTNEMGVMGFFYQYIVPNGTHTSTISRVSVPHIEGVGFHPVGMNRSVENAITRPRPASRRDATGVDGVAFLRDNIIVPKYFKILT